MAVKYRSNFCDHLGLPLTSGQVKIFSHLCLSIQDLNSSTLDSLIVLVSIILYTLGGMASDADTGLIRTIRWSEGLPVELGIRELSLMRDDDRFHQYG